MSISVSKTFHVCTAHRLMGHPKGCQFLHGHNYAITVYLHSAEFWDYTNGMVMDFGEVKKQFGKILDDLYDHKCLLQQGDPLIPILQDAGQQVTVFPSRPTAENMAVYLINYFNKHLCELGIVVFKVTVEETPGAIAIAEEGACKCAPSK